MVLIARRRRVLIRAGHKDMGAVSRELAAGRVERQTLIGSVDAGESRPSRPQLVSPKELTRRGLGTKEGHAALIHSLCHIEFNAINLALDAVYRFRGMPESYYGDWWKVAKEEAYHFDLLRKHLSSLGYTYGDFVAHNGLWQAALDTAHDPLVRMALVPRVLEARGLDVTPGIMKRLQEMGDQRAVEILKIIHRDEIGHVAIGSRWFKFLCQQSLRF